MQLPTVHKPENLALHLGVPVRTLRAVARKKGACRIIGKTMFFTDPDVILLLEVIRPCSSHSINAAKSGTTGAPLTKAGYQAARERLTKKSPNASPRSAKPKSGVVISMDRGRT